MICLVLAERDGIIAETSLADPGWESLPARRSSDHARARAGQSFLDVKSAALHSIGDMFLTIKSRAKPDTELILNVALFCAFSMIVRTRATARTRTLPSTH